MRLERKVRALARGALCASALALAAALAALSPWPRALSVALAPDPALLGAPQDRVWVDRTGRPLRHGAGEAGTRGSWTPHDRLPQRLVHAFLAAEDARFYSHPGVDPAAIARAAFDNVTHGRVVSGASTITGQLVRILEPRPRTLVSKAVEAVRSLALEKLHSKDELLEQYLNRVPMPGNMRGVTLAARVLFNRDPRALTLGESALLASLPQSPTRFDPRRIARAGEAGRRDQARLERRWRWVLQRMRALGYIGAGEHDAAAARMPELSTAPFPFAAPHLVDHLREQAGRAPGVVKTTLDPDVQELATRVLASHRKRLTARGARQAACVVLDTATSEVLAWVGSQGWEASGLGFNDGVLARRSAGSSVKPFAYAVALERGLTLASCLADVARTFATPLGDYDPRNFDRREHGPVLVRTALGSSLNQAAIEMARLTGIEPIADMLAALRLTDGRRDARDLGLGIVIGNAEVTLLDLAAAYATLARGGVHRKPALLLERPPDPGARLIAADVAYLITDVLADPAARLLTFGNVRAFQFGFPVALKTGTSTAYRDVWAAGYTSRYTVAVWAGNFDGAVTGGLSGATGAAPVLADLFNALHAGQPPRAFARPAGLAEHPVCASSGGLATPHCPSAVAELFLERRPGPSPCSAHRAGAGAVAQLPASYAQWLDRRAARGATGRFALEPAGAASARGGIEIAQPHANDRFVMPRPGSVVPSLTVRAVPRRTEPYLIWFVDGREAMRTPPPYRWDWPMARGHHELAVSSPDLSQTAAVRIHVE